MVKLPKILPFLAIVAGFAGSAFTSAQQNAAQSYYWYDAATGAFIIRDEQPPAECDAPGADCALGFITQPSDPLEATPDTTVGKSE